MVTSGVGRPRNLPQPRTSTEEVKEAGDRPGADLPRSVAARMLARMLEKIRRKLRRSPKTPEDMAAELESNRLRDEMQTVRVSPRGSAGESYQSGRGSSSGR